MKALLFGLVGLILWSCNQGKVEDTHLLNGYWEIEKVEFPSGETKTYQVNTVVDYFLLTGDSSGVRQKVMPQLDGTFVSNGDQEPFKITSRDNLLYLDYNKEGVTHSEQVISLNQEKFVVINKDELIYYYKPFKKFELK